MTELNIKFDDLEVILKRQIEDTLSAKVKEFFTEKGYSGLSRVIQSEIESMTRELLQNKFKDRIIKACEKQLTKNLDKLAKAACEDYTEHRRYKE